MKQKLYPIGAGLLLITTILSLLFSDWPLIRQTVERLDYLAYDLRLKAMLEPAEVDPRVVIIDVDEKSLREEGHWPWPRDRLATLVDKLFEGGVVVIAFDMVFAEAERNPAQMVLSRMAQHGIEDAGVRAVLQRNEPLFDNNAVFTRHLSGRDVILGFIVDQEERPPTGQLPAPPRFADPEQASRVLLPTAKTFTGNTGLLVDAGVRGGFFNIQPDDDGIIRRAHMLWRYGEHIYPLLSLEAVRLYFLTEQLDLETARIGESDIIEAIRLGENRIPTDQTGRVVIPFRGPRGSFPYISASDVLHDRIPETISLPGTIALIGTTTKGLFDLRATPIGGVYPGVEAHANIISGILDSGLEGNAFPVEPSWATGANFALTVLFGLLSILALPFLSPMAMILFTTTVGVGIITLNFWLWSAYGLILSLAPPLLLVITVGLFNIAYGFLGEARGRRQLKGMFGQYVPHELVDEMNRDPDRNYGFEGDTREMSVLFCDIRDFTPISEQLSAARLKELLNDFFTPMTRVLFEHRGTIDKYVGDMIMAFWGAPVSDPHHAENAVAAALEMLRGAGTLKSGFAVRGLPELQIGIGINSGLMNVGDMGSEYRRAYTVLGDAVNLASRLEGITKDYRVGLAVGEETRRLAGDAFVYRELDRVRVKGKRDPVTVYQPICRAEEAGGALREELAEYERGLTLFRAREWDRAEAVFRALHATHPDVYLYKLYLGRTDALRADDPGEEWDGVYARTNK